MLNHTAISGPALKDPNVKVRVLAPIRVAGQECEVGGTVAMTLSDAQALRASTPPSVEIL
jgi:hypothetical protein